MMLDNMPRKKMKSRNEKGTEVKQMELELEVISVGDVMDEFMDK